MVIGVKFGSVSPDFSDGGCWSLLASGCRVQ